MKNRDRIPVSEGSGNIFADLGPRDAAGLSLRAELTRQIVNRVKALDLNQSQTAKRLGLSQPVVSRLLQGRHTGLSSDRLLALLNLLDVDIEIVLYPQQHTSSAKGIIKIREAATPDREARGLIRKGKALVFPTGRREVLSAEAVGQTVGEMREVRHPESVPDLKEPKRRA